MGNPIEDLAGAAVQIASRGAAAYLAQHDLSADLDTLTAAVKEKVKEAFPMLWGETKEAMSCGMTQVAEANFAAGMFLAGTQAAQAVTR